MTTTWVDGLGWAVEVDQAGGALMTVFGMIDA
jgi:hypothetical protein